MITCDNEVLLQSLTGPLLWNQDLFSDSLLVSASGIVEAQQATLDLTLVDLGEEYGYLDLGDGFNNLSFPVTIAARFSIPEGHENFQLFATDEGLGYSGISLTYTTQGWIETFIGDGYGGGQGQRRSKMSYCSLSTNTWHTVVAIIRGATDHSVYLDGVELEGDYSGSGNGQIVDLGRPATIGYHVPDSGPLVGQEWSSTIKFDFLGVYDFELDPTDIVHAEPCGTDNTSALVRPSGAVGWYDFNDVETYADSEGNQAQIQVVGEVQTEVTYCLCPGIEQVEVQLFDCEYADFFCGDGTTWDAESQTCIVANLSDTNFDGCVSLIDLLDLLSAFGNCDAQESPWQCGNSWEYQGYNYQTVPIGEQCWFAENLRSENYRNGDSIPAQLSEEEWGQTSEGATAIFGEGDSYVNGAGADEEINLPIHGRLYNGFAVQDSRGLCPSGWSVSAAQDWADLRSHLEDGGLDSLGVELRTAPTWNSSGAMVGRDSPGMSWKGSGNRMSNGHFNNMTIYGEFRLRDCTCWAETGYGAVDFWVEPSDPKNGASVRCIKDTE